MKDVEKVCYFRDSIPRRRKEEAHHRDSLFVDKKNFDQLRITTVRIPESIISEEELLSLLPGTEKRRNEDRGCEYKGEQISHPYGLRGLYERESDGHGVEFCALHQLPTSAYIDHLEWQPKVVAGDEGGFEGDWIEGRIKSNSEVVATCGFTLGERSFWLVYDGKGSFNGFIEWRCVPGHWPRKFWMPESITTDGKQFIDMEGDIWTLVT